MWLTTNPLHSGFGRKVDSENFFWVIPLGAKFGYPPNSWTQWQAPFAHISGVECCLTELNLRFSTWNWAKMWQILVGRVEWNQCTFFMSDMVFLCKIVWIFRICHPIWVESNSWDFKMRIWTKFGLFFCTSCANQSIWLWARPSTVWRHVPFERA